MCKREAAKSVLPLLHCTLQVMFIRGPQQGSLTFRVDNEVLASLSILDKAVINCGVSIFNFDGGMAYTALSG
jgi:hypothetical protein